MSITRLFWFMLMAFLLLGVGDVVADEAVTETETETAVTETQAAVVTPQVVEYRSLQAIVDERRDRLQDRREALFDQYSGRRWFTPPWQLAHQDQMDEIRDQVRDLHRRRRDLSRRYNDSIQPFFTTPWNAHWRYVTEVRNYNSQMAQLDRIEAMDNLRFQRPVGFFW